MSVDILSYVLAITSYVLRYVLYSHLHVWLQITFKNTLPACVLTSRQVSNINFEKNVNRLNVEVNNF